MSRRSKKILIHVLDITYQTSTHIIILDDFEVINNPTRVLARNLKMLLPTAIQTLSLLYILSNKLQIYNIIFLNLKSIVFK